MTSPTPEPKERPGIIDAVPVRHPGRYVAIAVLAVLGLMFLHMVLFNPAFNWPFVFEAMNQSIVIEGFIKGTLLCTVLAMFFGVIGGVILAIMRLSTTRSCGGCRGCTPGSSGPSPVWCCSPSWACSGSCSR